MGNYMFRFMFISLLEQDCEVHTLRFRSQLMQVEMYICLSTTSSQLEE